MLTLFPEPWQKLWEAHNPNEHDLGAVFTKPEVVSLILDLAGYTVGPVRLASRRLLEPSCGDGAFLREIVSRLIESEASLLDTSWDDPVLLNAIRAVDVDERSLRSAQDSIIELLSEAGCPEPRANELAEAWTAHTDFLLSDWSEPFDFVVGNPPYVRIEAIAKPLLTRYRAAFSTLTNRADLYVAFIEKGLRLLSENGVLAYITANRFAKNQYGTALRKLIAKRYRVRHYLNLEHTQPFQSEVSAYPAIVVIDRQRGQGTTAATLEDLEPETFDRIRAGANGKTSRLLSEFPAWYPDGGPWIATSKSDYRVWERLAARHPTLEESAPGTRVGIGVATGADKVFVLRQKQDEIEKSRQIPLALARDISNDSIDWSGHYILNPFAGEDSTDLVELSDVPGMAKYLEEHRAVLEKRYVAKSRPKSWYRTIDRIWPSLQTRPKLLIPDIQRETTIGYDEGLYYPHHNLYWITSESWNLRALKTILRSSLVLDQVRAYSVQMRGGSLRFQAQTLRRIRVPRLDALSPELIEDLVAACDTCDQSTIDEVVERAFRSCRTASP